MKEGWKGGVGRGEERIRVGRRAYASLNSALSRVMDFALNFLYFITAVHVLYCTLHILFSRVYFPAEAREALLATPKTTF